MTAMKRLLAVAGAGMLALVCGCVTETHVVALTGDIMVDGPNAISNGPPRDKVLWEYRTASGALRLGDYDLSKQMLDQALLTLGGIYGKDQNAKKSRSYFHEEAKKTFIGEPYERVMAYYYRGILYWRDGEPDNARACFRSGALEDSSSEGQQYNADYALLDYLDGLASVRLGGDGSDAFARAQKECRFRKPPPYDPEANVLFFVEFGPGPRKFATGDYHEELRIAVPGSVPLAAEIKLEDRTITVGPYDDLGFQATTRGGRVMDHILANKAVFKTATGQAGTAAMMAGAIAATSEDRTAQQVGIGLLAVGLIASIISASTTPAADVRTWDNLPHYLSFAAVRLPPGEHTVAVEFLDRYGQHIPGLAKTITINVPEDKRDQVVFVSDHSTTPQTL